MKIYKVKVNGKVYEVELESVSEKAGAIEAAPAPAPSAAPSVAPAPQVVSGEGVELKAPMQGTILDVKVSVGQAVKKGDVAIILEAMKLENEIVILNDGVVQQVLVQKGQNVNNQQVLLIIG